MFALLAVDANAVPLAPSKQMAVGSTITLVRDDCGRANTTAAAVDTACEITTTIAPNIAKTIAPHYSEDCHRGWRFSHSRGHCVRIDSDNGARAIGTILSVIGGGNDHQAHQQDAGADGRDD